jgi:hypothetical protein
MLRQDELAFIKAISSLQVSLALLRDVRSALAARKKKTAVAAGSRSTTRGGGPKASSQLAGKRKANELLSSGDSMEPANKRPAPDTGSALLPALLLVTGEQAAIGSQQLGTSEGGATYAAILAGDVTLQERSGPLKPTAMDSDPSESTVSTETANRRMSSDMSGPLSSKRMAPLLTPRWPTPAYQQDCVRIRHPFLFQGTVPSVSGCGSLALAVSQLNLRARS